MKKPIAIVTVALTAFLAVLGVVTLLALHPTIQRVVLHRVLDHLIADSGYTVRVRTVHVRPSGELTISGISAIEPDGSSLIEVDRVVARADLLALVNRRVVLDRITLGGGSLALRRTEDEELSIAAFGLAFAGDREPTADTTADSTADTTAWEVLFRRIEIRDMDVDFVPADNDPSSGSDQFAGSDGHLRVHRLDVDATDFRVFDGEVSVRISRLSGELLDGIELDDGALVLTIVDKAVRVDELRLHSGETRVAGRFSIEQPEQTAPDNNSANEQVGFAVTLKETTLEGELVRDLLARFVPAIAEAAGRADVDRVFLELTATGDIRRFDVERLEIDVDGAILRANGIVHDPGGEVSVTGELERLRFGRQTVERLGLATFVPDRFHLPDELTISGPFTVGRTDVDVDFAIESSAASGHVRLRTEWIDADEEVLLGSPPPDTRLMRFLASVQFDEDALDADMEGWFAPGRPEVFEGAAAVRVASITPYRFGYLEPNMRIATRFSAWGRFGEWDDLDVNAEIESLVVTEGERIHQLESMELHARAAERNTSISVESSVLTVALESSIPIPEILPALQRHLTTYVAMEETETADPADTAAHGDGTGFGSQHGEDGSVPSGVVSLRLNLREPPEVLIPLVSDLLELQPVTARLDFDEGRNTLTAEVQGERIRYRGITVDALAVVLEGRAGELDFELGAQRLDIEDRLVLAPSVQGTARGDGVVLRVGLDDQAGEELLRSGFELTGTVEGIVIVFQPKEFSVRGFDWVVSEDHRIILTGGLPRIENLTLSREQSRIQVAMIPGDDGSAEVSLVLEDVDLESVVPLVGDDAPLVRGIVNAEALVTFTENRAPLGSATFATEGLEVAGRRVGQATGEVDLDGDGRVSLTVSLREDSSAVTIAGWVEPGERRGELTAELDPLDLEYIRGYIPDELEDARGAITGTLTLSGSLDDPNLTGSLAFRNAGFSLTRLGTEFSIGDESIEIVRNLIRFTQFRVRDRRGNSATVNGTVRVAPEPADVQIDLAVTAGSFTVLNTSARRGTALYGTVHVNSNLRLRGTLSQLEAEGSIGLASGSSVTLVLPEAGPGVQDAEGVVRFVDLPDEDEREPPTVQSVLRGLDVTTTVVVDWDTRVEIIVDQRSGDRLRMRGGGDLSLGIDPGGAITLSGQYVISEGTYVLSFFNVTRREFAIRPDSTVTWSGDPTEGALDVRAIYSIRTSPLPLLMPAGGTVADGADVVGATETNGTATSGGETVGAPARRQPAGDLPFQVVLTMEGTLLRPEISFSLDMPPEERTGAGSAAYAMITQINADESRRNTQAFALIVLNQFVAEDFSGIDEAAVFTAGARTSASRLLTYQLNALSRRLIRGVDVSFVVDSWEEFTETGPEGRTELQVQVAQRFLNDRLVVRFGGQVEVEGDRNEESNWSDFAGDISVEYLITRDGRYRIRAFRERGYEGPLDGSLTRTGISFLFTQDFDRVEPWWRRRRNQDDE